MPTGTAVLAATLFLTFLTTLPDFILPDDPLFCNQWYFHSTGLDCDGNPLGVDDVDMDMPEAWALMEETTSGDEIIVAHLDTGFHYDHEDTRGNLWVNAAEDLNGNDLLDAEPVGDGGDLNGLDDDGNGYVDDVIGFNFVAASNLSGIDFCGFGPANPDDCTVHGTRIGGYLATVSDNGIGVAGLTHNFGSGLWRIRLMTLKVNILIGDTRIEIFNEAVHYAVDNGARIISSSQNMLGGEPPCNLPAAEPIYEAIAYARDHGVLFISGSGNGACDIDGLSSFLNYGLDNMIVASAANLYDDLLFNSDYGKATVDLCTPAHEMTSIDIKNGADYKIFGGRGTSYSAPFLAGVAAMVWLKHPAWSHEQVRETILRSAEYKGALVPWVRTGARLNAYNALRVAEGLDSDGEGIGDGVDNCPFQANPLQEDMDGDGGGDACDPDIDGDGVANDMDTCILLANPDQFDSDGDRFADPCDNCPDLANPRQLDVDRNGIGDDCEGEGGCWIAVLCAPFWI